MILSYDTPVSRLSDRNIVDSDCLVRGNDEVIARGIWGIKVLLVLKEVYFVIIFTFLLVKTLQ